MALLTGPCYLEPPVKVLSCIDVYHDQHHTCFQPGTVQEAPRTPARKALRHTESSMKSTAEGELHAKECD